MVQVTRRTSCNLQPQSPLLRVGQPKGRKGIFEGINKLEKAGIPPSYIRAYMLIGFDRNEIWDRIWYRFKRMVEREIEPRLHSQAILCALPPSIVY
jgi:hypothetical protein